MKVAVISSVYGGYDQPVTPAEQDIECEWVLVSDRPYDCDPWQVFIEPRPSVHPRLAAKVAKCRPDLYAKADAYLWIDANIQINDPAFVSWVVGHLERGQIAQFPHPQRISIHEEAHASASMAKYGGLPLFEQVQAHVTDGYIDGWGLWATGLIATRCDLDPGFGDAWLTEQIRWTYQDQLSEPPVLYRRGLRPVDLNGGLWGNPRFTIRGHASEK